MIAYALVVLIAGLEYLHWRERKQLINRIQAKDVHEFKILEDEPKPEKKTGEEPKPINWQ